MNETIGYIVGGGLREGFRIRLMVPADQVQEGSFLVCDSGRLRYYGLVTDLQLGATDPRFADEKTDRMHPAIQQALLGKTLYTTLEVLPTLMQERGPDPESPEYQVWAEQIDLGQIHTRAHYQSKRFHPIMSLYGLLGRGISLRYSAGKVKVATL